MITYCLPIYGICCRNNRTLASDLNKPNTNDVKEKGALHFSQHRGPAVTSVTVAQGNTVLQRILTSSLNIVFSEGKNESKLPVYVFFETSISELIRNEEMW